MNKFIRNFCIIAHIDHGKSTLADRLLETTQTITSREMKAQFLDNMDLERERGITIKSHAIQMDYLYENENYTLNLIDTPGHVDFSYEVSRSIVACEGALLVVDASQGIEAQTISNLYLAIDQGLEIIPILNKVDLPGARIEEVKDEIIGLLGCKNSDILQASAKKGWGIKEILDEVIKKIPFPNGKEEEPLQAMIFDSIYNTFRGIEVYFRIFNGIIKKNDKIKFINTGKIYTADEIGILKLKQIPKEILKAGNVGYLISGIKKVKDVKVGDTITTVDNPCNSAVKGFSDVKPMIFAGIYPVDTSQYEDLRDTMEKLQLNDASLIWEPETSLALGFGFRCGFLGMLHMDIIQERLEREFNMNVIITVPSVQFHSVDKHNETKNINSPAEMPDPNTISHLEEPIMKVQIITASEFIGGVMTLCIERRGILKNQTYLTPERIELTFEMPLAEIVFDFFDKLKSISRGYASLDYELIKFERSNMIKLDIILNGDKVDALSVIVHRDKAYDWGKKLCKKLKDLLLRQMFEVAIQASIGLKVIARETIKAMRKNVTAKCYGGDISRKRKLLEKQKKGKKRMRQVGNIEIPQDAFLAILKIDE